MAREEDPKKGQKQQEEQTESLKEVAKRLNEKHERDKKFLKHQVKEMDVLKSIAGVLMDIRHQLAVDALNRKRQLKAKDADTDTGRTGAAEAMVLKEDRLGKLMKIMAGIVAAVAGIVAGLVAGFAAFLKDVTLVAKGIKNLAKNSETLKKIIVPIEKFFQRIRVNIKLFARNVSRLSKDTSKLGKIMEPVRKTFAEIGKFIRGFAATAKNSARTIGKIARYLTNFAKYFRGIFGIFFKIGKAVGRLVPAITAIMLIFDGLKESFDLITDESKSLSEKIIGAFFIIPKIIGKLFTDLGDMVKGAISWVIKKLVGEDNPVSKFLDSFSFTEMFSNFIDNLVKFIADIPKALTGLVDDLKNWWTLFKSDPKEGLKAMLLNIINLPKRLIMKLLSWFSPAEVEKQAEDTDESKAETQEEVKKSFKEIFTNVIASVKKFFTDTWDNLKTWFSAFDFWALIKKAPEKLSEVAIAIKDKVTGAISSLVGLFTGDSSIGETISKWWTGFKEDPLGGVLAIAMTPINMIKDGFDAVMGFFKLDTSIGESITKWWAEFKEDGVGGIAALAMAPINMLKGAFNSILSFFTGERAEQDAAADEESSNLFDTIMTSIKNTVKSVFTSVFNFFTGLFSFDAIKAYVPDVGGMLKKAGDWLTGLIDGAIEWIKDKLSFFGGGDSEEEKAAKEAERKKKAAMKAREAEIEKQIKAQYGEDSLNWGWGRGDAEAKELRDKMIAEAEAQYDQDGEFKPIKVPGNMGTALNPNVSGPVFSAADFATSPMPVRIVGTGQEMGNAGNDLASSQAIMEENRSQQAAGGGSTAIVAPSIVNNSSSSTTNVSTSGVPSTRDYSDYTQAFRPMGGSR